MDIQIYGVAAAVLHLLHLTTFMFLTLPGGTLAAELPSVRHSPSQINSNSVLVALLDSHYTELSELVEKALLLQTLEEAVSNHNITIFAPRNEALERDLDPEFKRFLLEPRNLKSLQNLLLYHIIPTRIDSTNLHPTEITHHPTLSPPEEKRLEVARSSVGDSSILRADDIIRPDGVIHGIERVLIPRSVQQDFNRRRSLRSISAVLPQGAPEIDPRTHRLKKPSSSPVGSPPALPIYDAMAPGPSLAPAPAPGPSLAPAPAPGPSLAPAPAPGPSLAPAPAPGPGGPHHHFDGEAQVKDFIQTLLHYGGYNELADILVNLTSLATEMGRLVSQGYVLTVLAPNDEAMAKLTTDQLSEPGAPEQIVYYHVVPEYQTEESMYNAVRRFGKVRYDTLRVPHKVVAEEADGSVKFGSGENSAYLFDPDIYTDGRISVQGIDGVLFPAEEINKDKLPSPNAAAKVVAKPRRGKLMQVTCKMLGAIGQDIHFSSCH